MSQAQNQKHKLSDLQLQYTAKCIAMVVRNAMEDFHVGCLSDAQMAELNPIIRNAIYTALYAMRHNDDPEANEFMRFAERLIPSYWEPPRFLANYPGTPTPRKK